MRKLCDVDEVKKCLDEVTGDDAVYAKGLLEWAIKKRTIDEADIRADERKKFAEWIEQNFNEVSCLYSDCEGRDCFDAEKALANYEKWQMKGDHE